MKNNKMVAFIGPIIYLILGIILLIVAESALRPICFILSSLLLLTGAYKFIKYLSRTAAENIGNNDFTIGLIAVIVSIVTFINYEIILQVIPVILSFFIILNGAKELQNAYDVHRVQLKNTWIVSIIAIANIIFGTILMLNPFATIATLLTAIGIALALSGLIDLIITVVIISKVSKVEAS